MTHDAKQLMFTEGAAQFVRHLTAILARLTEPSSDEQDYLRNQLRELMLEEEPHLIAGPIAFYRMSSILYQSNKPTMGELSHSLSVPLSTATRLVRWWVDNGFAERLSDQKDRRVVRIALTDSGQRFHEIVEGYAVQNVKEILGCLTAEEQKILIDLFGKMASKLK